MFLLFDSKGDSASFFAKVRRVKNSSGPVADCVEIDSLEGLESLIKKKIERVKLPKTKSRETKRPKTKDDSFKTANTTNDKIKAP